jgi:hypothetical protein
MRRYLAVLAAAAAVCALPASALAQQGLVDGYVAAGVDYVPNVDDAIELRTRLFIEKAWTAGAWRFRGAGLAEGLVADRDRARHDGHLQIREATVAWSGRAFDLRAGIGTMVWGRLDEVQPTDVINPLDASKYLLQGRADARLPVTHARVRWFAGRRLGAALHARPVRRPRRSVLPVQPPRRRGAVYAVAGVSPDRRLHAERAAAFAALVAGRCAPQRHHRPRRLGDRRV